MKSNIKSLIVISLGLILEIFINTSYCSAKTLDTTNIIPVTGRITFSENIENNIDNKNDIHGNFPIKDPFNQDKNLIEIPNTGDIGVYIYLLILISTTLILVCQYRKQNIFEKEELTNEKK
ncbi:hypothetical protein ACSXAY_17770 (plasmid) [Clostridium perfringens]